MLFQVEIPRYTGNALTIEGKAFKKPKAPAKQYIKEFKINKQRSKEDGAGDDSNKEEIITRFYSQYSLRTTKLKN